MNSNNLYQFPNPYLELEPALPFPLAQRGYCQYVRPVFYVSMCDCFSDSFATCIKGFCCPLCLNTALTYQLSTNEEPGCCTMLTMPWVCTPFYNKKHVDTLYGIRRSNCDDCMLTLCCYCCVIVQNQNNFKQLTKQK